MAKQLSIRDIAQMAGVSVATVSRVINNNGRFSEETRKRVQKVIDESGYVTNMAARSLRSSKSGNIGLILPDISNDFFSALAYHAERELQPRGYSVFVCNTGNDPIREREYFKTLTSKLVDGIICISGLYTLDGDIAPSNLPVVCVDRYPANTLDIPRVTSDETEGARLATSHLIERGCRRIAYISTRMSVYEYDNRRTGYMTALRQNGLTPDDRLTLYVSGKQPTMFEAEKLVRDIIRDGIAFDGIFASSDHAAVGALRALVETGVDVPGQVKVCGFDDSVYSRLTTPQISTIHRFPEQMARAGCDTLLALIEGKQPAKEQLIPVKLIERSSTAEVA